MHPRHLTIVAALSVGVVAACGPYYAIGTVRPARASLSLSAVSTPAGLSLHMPTAGYLTAWQRHGNRLALVMADSIRRPAGSTLPVLTVPRTGPALRTTFSLHVPAAPQSECAAASSLGGCLQYRQPPALPRAAVPQQPTEAPTPPIYLITLERVAPGQLRAALEVPLQEAEWPAAMRPDSAFAWVVARRLALAPAALWGFHSAAQSTVPDA